MIYPVILSGGSGTRLWPMSRALYPKQLLPLLTERQPAAGDRRRVADRDRASRRRWSSPMTSTASSSPSSCARSRSRRRAIVLEPVGRNTAPAVCVAALVARRDRTRRADAGDAVRPCHRRRRRLPRRRSTAPRTRRARRPPRHLRHHRRPARDRLWLYPPRRGARRRRRRLRGRRLRRKARPRERRRAYLAAGDYFWNSGIFLFPAALFSTSWSGCSPTWSPPAARRSPRQARSRFPAPRPRRLRRRREHLDRLCGDGAHRTRRGGAGRDGLERCRHLGRAVADRATRTTAGNVASPATSSPRTRAIAICAPSTGWSPRSASRIWSWSRPAMRSWWRRATAPRTSSSWSRGSSATAASEAAAHPLVHRPWGTYRSIHNGDRVQVKHIMVKPGAQAVACRCIITAPSIGSSCTAPPRWRAATRR